MLDVMEAFLETAEEILTKIYDKHLLIMKLYKAYALQALALRPMILLLPDGRSFGRVKENVCGQRLHRIITLVQPNGWRRKAIFVAFLIKITPASPRAAIKVWRSPKGQSFYC